MDNIRFDAISYPMLMLLFIVIGIIIFILIIEPRLSSKKLINKNEHGSSKFADHNEIHDNFIKEDLTKIDKVGFPVWYEKKDNKFKSVYFDDKSPHYLLVGSTGSGKSATVSIPMSIHFATAKDKHSVVLTDPKGELFKTTGKIFKDNGYDVITIDFRNPTESNKINVMQPIIDEWKLHCFYDNRMMLFLIVFLNKNKISVSKIIDNKKYEEKIKLEYGIDNYILEIIKNKSDLIKKRKTKKKKDIQDLEIIKDLSDNPSSFLENIDNEQLINYINDNQNSCAKHQAETNRLVISLSNLIFTEKESKDPFWINASKQLFVGIVGLFLEDYKLGLIDENKINLSSVKKFQNSSLIKENQIYLQKNLNTRQYGSLSKDYLTSILSSAENTYKSITTVFAEKMSIFDDLNVENIVSISEFQFTGLAKKPTALYIIVPDEDRAYFQLVTIIIGMLIKDLTKYANTSENNGRLPVKVEWILDEFANCPPLDSIETVVSVARSRGMRFYFFIQSFSQLDQVYGKEIANIIQDNCALVYLKTNTVETAEVISKKLGKSTIETNSINMSTDPFKIGANKTKSLMGKELLTTNEIISLKYKTIIFPTFGNPIFRDTYLYSDIYPNYKNCEILVRQTKVLQRLNNNYYTVEELRKLYVNNEDNSMNVLTKQIEKNYNREIKQQTKKVIDFYNDEKNKSINKNIEMYIEKIKSILKEKIVSEENIDGIYIMEINNLLNKFELNKLEQIRNKNYMFEIGVNDKTKKTIISIWDDLFEIEW